MKLAICIWARMKRPQSFNIPELPKTAHMEWTADQNRVR